MRTLYFAIMAAAWPTHALRAVLGGSGSAIMHEPAIVDAVLKLGIHLEAALKQICVGGSAYAKPSRGLRDELFRV